MAGPDGYGRNYDLNHQKAETCSLIPDSYRTPVRNEVATSTTTAAATIKGRKSEIDANTEQRRTCRADTGQTTGRHSLTGIADRSPSLEPEWQKVGLFSYNDYVHLPPITATKPLLRTCCASITQCCSAKKKRKIHRVY